MLCRELIQTLLIQPALTQRQFCVCGIVNFPRELQVFIKMLNSPPMSHSVLHDPGRRGYWFTFIIDGPGNVTFRVMLDCGQ